MHNTHNLFNYFLKLIPSVIIHKSRNETSMTVLTMTQQCPQKESTLRLLMKCLYNFGKVQSNLRNWAFREHVLCRVFWPIRYCTDLLLPSLPPLLERRDLSVNTILSILNKVRQEVLLPSCSIPPLFPPLRRGRVFPGRKPWDSISECASNMQQQNSSCQQSRELSDEKKKNLYAYPFSLYETPLCEALSPDQCLETFVLLPFADSACHSKEHTQELLQSLQKLFRQFYNHKED